MDKQFRVEGNGIFLKENDLFPMIRDSNPKNLEMVCHVLNNYGLLVGMVKLLKEKPYANMTEKQKVFIDLEFAKAENMPGED